MADNQKIKDLNKEYKEVLKTVEQIRDEEERLIQSGKKLSAQKKEELKLAEEYLEVVSEQIAAEKDRLNIEKETTKVLRSHAKLSSEVRKQLGLQTGQASVFKSLSIEIAEVKARQLTNEGESLEKLQKQEIVIDSTLSAMESQAKAVERALKGESGLEEIEQKRRDVQAAKLDLTEEQYKDLLDTIDATELLYKKEQRILQLKESQKTLFESLPDPIKNAANVATDLAKSLGKVGFALAAIVGLGAAIASALSLFSDLDKSAEEFRQKTGIAASQMRDIQKQAERASKDFAALGVSSSDFYDTLVAIRNEFGNVLKTSETTNRALTVLNKNYGAGNEELAKSLGLFQNIAGLSEETAANILLQTAELSTNVGVSFADVAKDIAESAENSNDFFRGNVKELINQTIQARRLGTTLSQVLKTSESLLDFESSITKELEAAAFTGGQFNLTRARALAAAGEEAQMQEEILKQIQRSGDFTTKNLFERRAIAAAVGMEVSEIDRLIGQQNRLNSLSSVQKDNALKLLDAGVDISNITDDQLSKEVELAAQRKEQQGQLSNIQNSFTAITTSLGTAFLPILEKAASFAAEIAQPFVLLGDVLKTINESLVLSVGFYGSLLALTTKRFVVEKMGVVLAARRNILAGIDLVRAEMAAGASLRRAIADVFGSSLRSFGFTPFGAIAGAALAGSVIAALFSNLSKVNDAIIPGAGSGYGKRALLEEGQITLFNNRDTIVAGTNLGGGNTPAPNSGADKLISTIERLEKAYMRGAQVNLDGQRVIRGLGRVGNETTQNNFSLI